MRRPLSVLVLNAVIVAGFPVMSHICGPAEYRVGQECCPMCAPGSCVHRNCTEYFSTLCVACPPSTYTDGPNARLSCSACGTCHYSKGLRVKRDCSSTSDTLCEPLDGHYCTDPIQDGCQGAVEHTKCAPGQFIRQNGSPSSDTVCGDCANGTYSDGSFTSCRPHTQCQTPGMDVIREGTLTSDAECGKHRINFIIPSVVAILALAAVLFLVCRFQRRGEQGDLVLRGSGQSNCQCLQNKPRGSDQSEGPLLQAPAKDGLGRAPVPEGV